MTGTYRVRVLPVSSTLFFPRCPTCVGKWWRRVGVSLARVARLLCEGAYGGWLVRGGRGHSQNAAESSRAEPRTQVFPGPPARVQLWVSGWR